MTLPWHSDGDRCEGIHCGNPEHGWTEEAPRAEGLDIDRLARAMAQMRWSWLGWTDRPFEGDVDRRTEAFHNAADRLAAEYASLAPQEP